MQYGFHILYRSVTICMLLLSLAACSRKDAAVADGYGTPLTDTAKLLSITDNGGYYLVRITDPWDTTRILHSYQLVPRGEEVPRIAGTTKVEIPLAKSLVYSAVYAGVIDEIGAAKAITAVADAEYINNLYVRNGVAEGRITDVGSTMAPVVEKVVAASPDAILASPFQNAGYGAVGQLNIPIIEMADYMETTPLGRAEWIKLIGLLYGRYNVADSIYQAVSAAYNDMKGRVVDVASRPKVLTETLINGVWNVPGGRSYKVRMLQDAGASYPWADDTSAGSLDMDFSRVYDRASDADYWIATSYGYPMTRATLAADYRPNERFKAFQTGNVYTCDTSVTPLFDEFPFHPERLLNDYVVIFHPEAADGLTLNYFHKME